MFSPSDPAFPSDQLHQEDAPQVFVQHPGLTKRELFAAMAMQGFAACQGAFEEWSNEKHAACSVNVADALIAELNKPKAE